MMNWVYLAMFVCLCICLNTILALTLRSPTSSNMTNENSIEKPFKSVKLGILHTQIQMTSDRENHQNRETISFSTLQWILQIQKLAFNPNVKYHTFHMGKKGIKA